MRKGLAGLILGLALVVASVSWAGFVMTRTVLDPSRSERLADQLLDNEVLRQALVGRLSDAMGAALPAEAPVPRQQLETAADRALEDERVEALLRDGLVQIHQNALEGNDVPITIDATALGAAARDSLVETRPELESVLPAAPPMEVDLPTAGLSWLGGVRSAVTRYTNLLAMVAAAGALIALLVTKDRPAVLRRVSFWAFGAALFWVIVGYGIPFLAETLAPSSGAIVAALVDVFFGAMIPPAIMMAVFGGLLLGASFLWSTVSDRRPAALMQPRGSTGDPNPQLGQAVGTGRVSGVGRQTSNVRPGGNATTGPSQPAEQVMPTYADRTSVMQRSEADPTMAMTGDDKSVPDNEPWSRAEPAPAVQSTFEWQEGIGYVERESGEPSS